MSLVRHVRTVSGALFFLFSMGMAQAAPVFVGSWHVGEGPIWDSNPQTFTAREAAALLFGGSPGDYAISTVSNNPADINFMAFVDGWGDSAFLTTPVNQDFELDVGAPGYADPGGFGTSYSAYVLDHSCLNRYGNSNEACAPSEPGLNFAFRLDPVSLPEPGSLALLGAALFGIVTTRRRSY